MSIPHMRVNSLAPAEVIMPEPFKEVEDEESNLACIIRLCPKEFSVNISMSFEDNSTSTILLGLPGEVVGIWTIKPCFIIVLAE